eukprot:g1912.t1
MSKRNLFLSCFRCLSPKAVDTIDTKQQEQTKTVSTPTEAVSENVCDNNVHEMNALLTAEKSTELSNEITAFEESPPDEINEIPVTNGSNTVSPSQSSVEHKARGSTVTPTDSDSTFISLQDGLEDTKSQLHEGSEDTKIQLHETSLNEEFVIANNPQSVTENEARVLINRTSLRRNSADAKMNEIARSPSVRHSREAALSCHPVLIKTSSFLTSSTNSAPLSDDEDLHLSDME